MKKNEQKEVFCIILNKCADKDKKSCTQAGFLGKRSV